MSIDAFGRRRPGPILGVEPLEDRTVPAPLLGLQRNLNTLVSFDSATPTAVTTIPVTGLTTGDTLRAIDFRPVNNLLYGVATTSTNDTRLYVINPTTGAATPLGDPVDVDPNGSFYGIDFNPTSDRIRVVNDNDENLRLNPNNGARADTPVNDTNLTAGAIVDSVAYDNNVFDATATTLFALNLSSNSLARIGGVGGSPSPNGGVVTDIGPLGFAFNLSGTSLDIARDGTLFAGVRPNGGSTGLYTINPTTGAATLIGLIGDGSNVIDSLAVVPPDLKLPSRILSVGGSLDGTAANFAPTSAGQYPATPSATVSAFGATTVNVRTAVGDVKGDSVPDTILVTGPGTQIRFAAISGVDNTTVLIPVTAPFAGSEGFMGGGFVSTGDFDGDGRAEIVITPDQGGGPRVTIFSLNPDSSLALRTNFFGIDDPSFRGGARTGIGDVNNDGTPDLAVAAGFQGGPRIALFGGTSVLTTPARLVNDFFAFEDSLRNGAFVAIGDLNADGFGDLFFGAGPGGAPRVLGISGQQLITSGAVTAINSPLVNFFVAGNTDDRGGVRVTTKSADGDNRADLVTGSGEGSPARVRVYLGKNFTGTGEPATVQTLTVFGGVILTDGVFVG